MLGSVLDVLSWTWTTRAFVGGSTRNGKPSSLLLGCESRRRGWCGIARIYIADIDCPGWF